MMKNFYNIFFVTVFICILVFLSFGGARAKDLWWSYLAQYDNGAGSTNVDLSLRNKAPIAGYKYVIITGVSYIGSDGGLPDVAELDKLNKISVDRYEFIKKHTVNPIFVGTFSNDNQRLDYIYVTDDKGIKESLEKFYIKNYPKLKHYINIRYDDKWDGYINFLYPNEGIISDNRDELAKIGFIK